jgi:alkylation response protein AidB-like acyl-CoA dehydrogenase
MIVSVVHLNEICSTIELQGGWWSPPAYITFENVSVPVENIIGNENEGFQAIMLNFNHERFVIAVGANRGARTMIEEAITYARSRRTFGKRLIDHQVIRHKIADMAAKVESVHAFLELIAFQMNQNVPNIAIGSLCAMVKVRDVSYVQKLVTDHFTICIFFQ